MTSSDTVVCIGELLWDLLPDGRTLGGAPANVAYHLARLGHAATLVTRVGRDELGDAARAELAARGLDTSGVQVDDTLPTGAAQVTLDSLGHAEYRFVTPAAFDAIEPPTSTPEIVVFGTLAQRDARSAATIRRLVAGARVALYDVNLRAPHTSPETVTTSLPLATVVKLNADEAVLLATVLDVPAEPREFARHIGARYGTPLICITRGAAGAGLWSAGEWHAADGIAARTVDTVGAGDAFTAALLAGWLEGRAPSEILERANRLGAYVAARRGAMPEYEASALRLR
jgi:fructokinase